MIDELIATAREFAERELPPVALADDESEEYPQRELERAASLGLTCYDLPQGATGHPHRKAAHQRASEGGSSLQNRSTGGGVRLS